MYMNSLRCWSIYIMFVFLIQGNPKKQRNKQTKQKKSHNTKTSWENKNQHQQNNQVHNECNDEVK